MSKKGKKQKTYPGHFKQTVVEDVINHGLGYREAGRKYDVHGDLIPKNFVNRNVSHNMIKYKK